MVEQQSGARCCANSPSGVCYRIVPVLESCGTSLWNFFCVFFCSSFHPVEMQGFSFGPRQTSLTNGHRRNKKKKRRENLTAIRTGCQRSQDLRSMDRGAQWRQASGKQSKTRNDHSVRCQYSLYLPLSRSLLNAFATDGDRKDIGPTDPTTDRLLTKEQWCA